MPQHIANLTLLVRDYDEAIRFYVDKLGFELLEDTDRGQGKRWVRVAPTGGATPALLLAQAATDEQRAHVGNQAGGRVFLFLNTDDFAADYARYKAAGVQFLEEPRYEDYGSVVVFADLYGNKWDLLQLK
ncbi:VOC family protein [Hymenobacter gummosus]|uniref:VOC family protein n=1 Tax=Hymenobacter gummosus TaxID=1776032 RepID=A0A3S0H9T5_9BACT|nr:VOC family protein [Hymenobacter gummosus]RTQ50180.1 VOC family protein [Hymenobacter gummosus]